MNESASSRLAALQELLESDEYAQRFAYRSHSPFPEGHFYSPVPSDQDVTAFLRDRKPRDHLPGMDLGLDAQLKLLKELQPLYDSVPFSDDGTPGYRFRFLNDTYSYGDAIFLHLMIRFLRPRRFIEIGSGYSSCVTLDTNEHFFQNAIQCTFVEPYPALLQSLLKPDDRIDLVATRLQEVDANLFRELQQGDILFVDSTHVSKLGSDVNRLFFEILPGLARGVFVHIHDIFPEFEYPEEWLLEGRAWNEQYLLRAFLQYNEAFKIRLFPGLLADRERDWFAEHMPVVLRNPGGSIWIEKVR